MYLGSVTGPLTSGAEDTIGAEGWITAVTGIVGGVKKKKLLLLQLPPSQLPR